MLRHERAVQLIGQAAAWLAVRVDRLFPERQVFIRSRGELRYVRLGQRTQVILATLAVVAVAASVFVALMLARADGVIEARDRQVAQLLAINQEFNATIAGAADRQSVISLQLENNYRQLRRMAEQRRALEDRFEEFLAQLGGVVADRDRAKLTGQALHRRVTRLEADLLAATILARALEVDLADATESLDVANAERDSAVRDNERLTSRAAKLSGDLRRSTTAHVRLVEQHSATEVTLRRATEALATAEAEARARATKTAALDEQLAQTGKHRARAENQLALARRQLAEAQSQRSASDQKVAELNRLIADFASDLAVASRDKEDAKRTSNVRKQRLGELEGQRDVARRQAAALRAELTAVQDALSKSTTKKTRRVRAPANADERVRKITAERDMASRQADLLATRVGDLQGQLNDFKDHQLGLVERLYQQATADARRAEKTLAMTGLDVGDLARAAGQVRDGRGGPLVALNRAPAAGDDLALAGDPFLQSVSRLEVSLAHWNGMRDLLRRVPLGRPTDRGWRSSHFGKRRDPLSRRMAMHAGLDISAPHRTPVFATAPGRVTFVGPKGPYGRMVEIDHGLGFMTRYAHLQKILVKHGAEVAYRDRIGLMGSTGRSSGTHVHYEVIYRGKPQNPAKFIEAGNYVFQERVS